MDIFIYCLSIANYRGRILCLSWLLRGLIPTMSLIARLGAFGYGQWLLEFAIFVLGALRLKLARMVARPAIITQLAHIHI